MLGVVITLRVSPSTNVTSVPPKLTVNGLSLRFKSTVYLVFGLMIVGYDTDLPIFTVGVNSSLEAFT